MEPVSKEEFMDWMNHPVTKNLRQGMLQLAQIRQLALAEKCGLDSGSDREEKGYIRGLIEAWDHRTILEDMFQEEENEPSRSGS